MWLSSANCSQILKQFSIGYHKAIKKIFNFSNRESNHNICKLADLFVFDHFLNSLKISTFHRLMLNPCKFVHKNMISFKRGKFFRTIDDILKNNYGIRNVLENDIDALKSRILFVQNLEDPLR